MRSKTVVFIHGMFMTSLCWEDWIPHFEVLGYHCLAPEWPGRKGSAAELRQRHPDQQLGTLSLKDVLYTYERAIATLSEPPILIGHSIGGLVVQLLLGNGLGSMGVAIDSAPPRGMISTQWSFIKSNWPLLNPFIPATRPYLMSFEEFQYSWVHTLPYEKQREAYDRHVVPESRVIGRAGLTPDSEINFKKQRPSLLFIAGGEDRTIPASLNRMNCDKYTPSHSVTDFKEFPGRTHFICGQDGWEEVADYTIEWLEAKG